MNIHPLFVHFPIALLALYSVLELSVGFIPALSRQTWILPVKAFLLFTGVLAAFAALVTGGIAEELIEGSVSDSLIETHSLFAGATTVLYLALAVMYLIRVFDRKGWGNYIAGMNSPFIRIWSIKRYLAHLVLDTWFLPVLSLLALMGMVVTGALGAAIVYGPDVDPFVSFIYRLLLAR
jgi:uncharacterized membrane protein